MFTVYHLMYLWIVHPIRRLLIMMQIRRDLSIFFFLLILVFLIVLFYQFHYTHDPFPRIPLPKMTKNDKFRIEINEYPSVGIFISYVKITLCGLILRSGIKRIVLKSNFPKNSFWKTILNISKMLVHQTINSVSQYLQQIKPSISRETSLSL